MPYSSTEALPVGIRHRLPGHAQHIYREAFNNAWEEYSHDERVAHRVAWAAVKKQYHKGPNGQWVRRGAWSIFD